MKKLMLIFVGLVALTAIFGGDRKDEPRRNPRDFARSACAEFLERTLNDPSSAEWVEISQWPSVKTGVQDYRVQMRVRAKNGFGALMLADYLCVVRDLSDKWELISLNQIE